MEIKSIQDENKELYINLLLIGDEERQAVLKYLYSSDIYVLIDQKPRSIIAIESLNNNIIEIKNLGTLEDSRGKGYASKLIEYIISLYKKDYKFILVGTGETENNINYYKNRGFREFRRIENFFIDNYSKPIIDDGVELKDMIVLRKKL